MASKYVQLTELSAAGDLYSSMLFLVSKGEWTDDDPISGDIFTNLSSYRVRYDELSGNLTHSIVQTTGRMPDDPICILSSASGGFATWNFKTDGGLRIASNGPLSSVVPSDVEYNAAINFETCRALSSDAWWQVHRRCFDAARAREMSGVVNRMLMEKGRPKLGVNKFGIMAVVYDLLNRHWMASDYFKRKNVLTCAFQIDRDKREVTLKNAAQAGITTSLYGVCPFKCWTTLPFTYDPAVNNAFKVGTTDTLSEFAQKCFTYGGKPISYALIDKLDALSDVKANIDMSIYDQNRFSSLSGVGSAPVSHWSTTAGGHTYSNIPYKTIKTVYPPPDVDPSTPLSSSSIGDVSGYGPTYLGNVYLYPAYIPYRLPLWDDWHNNGSSDNFVYQSEPNPCGSKKTFTLLSSTYGNDILFNPQQAIWEYRRYQVMKLKKEGHTHAEAESSALPGDLMHFFEKFCKVQLYFVSKSAIPSNMSIGVKYTPPPRPYMLSPSRKNDTPEELTITYESNSVDDVTMHTGEITVAGNEPTLFQFKHGNGIEDSEWLIWIDAMWVW